MFSRKDNRKGARHARRRRTGFTLVELLLVMVILGVLAAVVVPKFRGRSEQARLTAAQTQIANFETALDAFEVDNGYYPRSAEGLLDLVERPNNAKNWRGPYLRHGIPRDPWENEYVYTYPGKNNEEGYDLMSMGLDGRVGGGDDIINWQDKLER